MRASALPSGRAFARMRNNGRSAVHSGKSKNPALKMSCRKISTCSGVNVARSVTGGGGGAGRVTSSTGTGAGVGSGSGSWVKAEKLKS